MLCNKGIYVLYVTHTALYALGFEYVLSIPPLHFDLFHSPMCSMLDIPQILMAIPDSKVARMQRRLARVWQRFA